MAPERIGVEALLDLSGSAREAKAYAFLYAAFRRTEISETPVRDALDCLLPFIAPYVSDIAGQPIKMANLCDYLKSNFGFDFPIYAMEQLVSELPKHGLADYNKLARTHIAKKVDNGFSVAKSEIETSFDLIVDQISRFATSLGFAKDPPSGTWGDALISFLRGSTDPKSTNVVKIKGALLEGPRTEAAVVGAFLQSLHRDRPDIFDQVVNMFMGILVEEFITAFSGMQSHAGATDLIVVYDTPLLLRLMGTSGKLFRLATEELTRYLQDLGCQIYYFAGNESEIENIFSTIIHIKDSGGELEGETAEALSNGEVSISDIRMLQNSFAERLATHNVFPADRLDVFSMDLSRFQIDESMFSKYIRSEAALSGRLYKYQNRENDAQYLASIMRMRRGIKTRDFLDSKAVFITPNRFLARTARKFLVRENETAPQHFPPIATVGQAATIAWLMKDHKLIPEKAGRELLSNCYAAVRPDAEWFRYFREGIEKSGADTTNALTVQAARRIAKEETLGNATLMRDLNMAEVLGRAEAESARIIKEKEDELFALKANSDIERDRLVGEARAEFQRNLDATNALHAEAVTEAKREAELAAAEMIRSSRVSDANDVAKRIVWVLRTSALVAFFGTSALGVYLRINGDTSILSSVTVAVLALLTVITFANFLKIPFIANWIPNLETWLGKKLTPPRYR